MKRLKNYFNKNIFKLNFYTIIGFALLWLANGFSLGTLTLLGPVEWLSSWARKNNYNQQTENLLVKTIILIFVILSFLISVWLMKRVVKSKLFVRISVFIICYSFAGVALYLLLNPEIFAAERKIENAVGESQFTLGSYPTEDKLIELKEQGFTTVICLLHPAIVPFEPILINKERKEVTDIGMKFINIPMLPWISDNDEAIQKIKLLIKNKNEKYYMHCYLGKDRVNVMKRIILSENATVKEDSVNSGRRGRTLEEKASFERGKIYVLSKSSIYFTPYPTDEEFFSIIARGDIKVVVSLLNPDKPAHLRLINKEKEILKKYKIPFKLLTITDKTSDTKIKEYINVIKTFQKPLLIHNFKTDDPVSQNFINLYNKQNKVKN